MTLDPELALSALRIVGDFGRKRDAIGTGFGITGFPIITLRMGWHVVPDLEMSPHLGSTFHYVGLLAPLDRPMVRSGTIGAVDQIGVPHDYDGCSYACHLADRRSYGGFSGSPCFLEIPFSGLTAKPPPPWLPKASGPVGRITFTHVLCGMFTEHLDSEDPMKAVSRLGVGIMLRASDICRAIAEARAC